MAGNSFGEIFRITSFGESHGPAIGVVIDGCPAGLEISQEEIQTELDRRKPGQKLTSERTEEDRAIILSGIFEGKTLGTPIAIIVENKDAKPGDYENLKDIYRPGHADFAYEAKYGIRDWRGGGRASARETIARVIAGAIAKKYLRKLGIKISAQVIQIGAEKDSAKFETEIEKAKNANDSIGGIIEIRAQNVPAGLGEPVFDKLEAKLAQALMSIPAVKGFETGNGFKAAEIPGSENNKNTEGISGGISTGEEIIMRIALKAPSSISQEQVAKNRAGEEVSLKIKGRHDPCVCFRAIPIAEAMTALTILDFYLRQKN
jgi:chorismate synthase